MSGPIQRCEINYVPIAFETLERDATCFIHQVVDKKKIEEGVRMILEGIGEDMLVDAVDYRVIDDMLRVTDKQAFKTARKMAHQEGIFGGGSSGAAMWGALRVAESAAEDQTVVTILPDTGFRYLSKFYQDKWMADHDMLED